MIRQEFENGNFVSLAFHYNENRNAFYRNTSDANFDAFGRDYENLDVCTRDAPTAGVARRRQRRRSVRQPRRRCSPPTTR